ncbi:MAG: hypothetical protein R2849_10630 [Thermomicrobiales bacterium]
MSVVSGTGGDGVYLRDDVYGATCWCHSSGGAVGDILDGPLYDIDGPSLVDGRDRLRHGLGPRRLPWQPRPGQTCPQEGEPARA